MEETAMHLPCVQSMISFLDILEAVLSAGDRYAERAQGEFREIRPLKSYYLYSTLWANRRARISGQARTKNDSEATMSLARDAKPIALRPMALPGNCQDGMEEIEVPEPMWFRNTGNRLARLFKTNVLQAVLP
jgi:hypothetical protein